MSPLYLTIVWASLSKLYISALGGKVASFWNVFGQLFYMKQIEILLVHGILNIVSQMIDISTLSWMCLTLLLYPVHLGNSLQKFPVTPVVFSVYNVCLINYLLSLKHMYWLKQSKSKVATKFKLSKVYILWVWGSLGFLTTNVIKISDDNK